MLCHPCGGEHTEGGAGMWQGPRGPGMSPQPCTAPRGLPRPWVPDFSTPPPAPPRGEGADSAMRSPGQVGQPGPHRGRRQTRPLQAVSGGGGSRGGGWSTPFWGFSRCLRTLSFECLWICVTFIIQKRLCP